MEQTSITGVFHIWTYDETIYCSSVFHFILNPTLLVHLSKRTTPSQAICISLIFTEVRNIDRSTSSRNKSMADSFSRGNRLFRFPIREEQESRILIKFNN